MAATAAVLNTYELVDNIVLWLPTVYINRAAQISHVFRTVINESAGIQESIRPMKSLRQRDIALADPRDTFGNDTVIYRHLCMDAQRKSLIETALAYHLKEDQVPRDFFASPVPMQTRTLLDRPHYTCLADGRSIEFNPALLPKLGFRSEFHGAEWHVIGYKSKRSAKMLRPLGNIVKLELPRTDLTKHVFGNLPCQWATEPPVMAMRLELIGQAACTAYSPTGLRVGDLVRVQKAMLQDQGHISEPRCVLSIVVGVVPRDLRSVDMAEITFKRETVPEGRIDKEHKVAAAAHKRTGSF